MCYRTWICGTSVFVRLNKKYKTVGFDTSLSRTSFLKKKKKDLNNEINPKDLHLFNGSKITSNPRKYKRMQYLYYYCSYTFKKQTHTRFKMP